MSVLRTCALELEETFESPVVLVLAIISSLLESCRDLASARTSNGSVDRLTKIHPWTT